MLNNCWKQKAKIKFSKLEKNWVNVRCHGILTLLWVNWCARKEYWAVATARDAHERWVGGLNQPTVAENLVATSLQKRTWTHRCLPPFWGLTNQSNQISQFPRKTIKVTRFFFPFFLNIFYFSRQSRELIVHITAFFTRPWCAIFYLTNFFAFC